MNEKLLNYIKEEPSMYAESSKEFWDDAHISKCMLEAHLDKENDGASRKMETIQASVQWIGDYCKERKSKQLLDLGCGPGIYSELLNDEGFYVTGIDFSKRSIEYAKNHAKENNLKIKYYYQDYLKLNYENEFDVAILIYCDFGVLSPADRNSLLKRIYKSLKRDGILIMDVYNKPYLNSFHELKKASYENGGFWTANPHAVIQTNKYYNETGNTLEQYIIITEDDCECYNVWNQIYSKETLAEELRKAGFLMVDIFDDVKGTDFTGNAETMCGVFRKQNLI